MLISKTEIEQLTGLMMNTEQHYSHKMHFVLLWLSPPRSILNQVKFISSVGGEIRGWFVKFFQAIICF